MVTDKDNSNGDNGEKKEIEQNTGPRIVQPEEPPKVCARCEYWKLELAMINQQTKQGMSPCTCEDQEAPHGVVMAGFGDCCCWEERKRQPKIVTPPKGLNLKNRLKIP